ncbi:OsmC family protein [Myroides pelagicus]|uniref:OsmC family peroxiredoxin n=1 Tax=Myroides pelagicus TaxID=270914 RepID=A0A7K1GNK5_9FLAO|nr:OsmC family protein [Myroides pelagicus]MEC4113869.1 OsmC family protein [Myroides pelagicus]MTH30426.1 OsmC family peroxiredoxin [Myroides pelagicus]
MDVKVKAVLKDKLYHTEVIARNNLLISDEPKELGGGDEGFNPFELLATSLASCTAATLRMYADRKEWYLGEVTVEIDLKQKTDEGVTTFVRKVMFSNKSLDDNQLSRLEVIANKCPVHKVLVGEIVVTTTVEI